MLEIFKNVLKNPDTYDLTCEKIDIYSIGMCMLSAYLLYEYESIKDINDWSKKNNVRAAKKIDE